ncbi:hypothetical protein LTR86_010392 [Recurvomyces mirabilis]|nr:hypothetical protein LTR86_010392 [Recurvomyces mirabilis]
MSWLQTPITDEDLHDPWGTVTTPEEATILRGRPLHRPDQVSPRLSLLGDNSKIALAIQYVDKAIEIMGEIMGDALGARRNEAIALRKGLHEAQSYQEVTGGQNFKRKRWSQV